MNESDEEPLLEIESPARSILPITKYQFESHSRLCFGSIILHFVIGSLRCVQFVVFCTLTRFPYCLLVPPPTAQITLFSMDNCRPSVERLQYLHHPLPLQLHSWVWVQSLFCWTLGQAMDPEYDFVAIQDQRDFDQDSDLRIHVRTLVFLASAAEVRLVFPGT